MPVLQPPPTYALPIIQDERTKEVQFNPIWLKWFVDLAAVLSGIGGTTPQHNLLTGLQGGAVAEFYHLTQAVYTKVTTNLVILSGKTLTVDNTLTLAGTDSSTLNVGGGGTLGTAAFTASSAYFPATSTTGSGNVVLASSPTLSAPVLGAATGTSLAVTGAVSSSGTAGVGYATGAGGAVTQLTSRTTSVTINKTCGQITLFTAAGSVTATTFTVSNNTVAATDVVHACQSAGSDLYEVFVTAVTAGSFDITFFSTGGTLSDTPVFNFAVVKAVAA